MQIKNITFVENDTEIRITQNRIFGTVAVKLTGTQGIFFTHVYSIGKNEQKARAAAKAILVRTGRGRNINLLDELANHIFTIASGPTVGPYRRGL